MKYQALSLLPAWICAIAFASTTELLAQTDLNRTIEQSLDDERTSKTCEENLHISASKYGLPERMSDEQVRYHEEKVHKVIQVNLNDLAKQRIALEKKTNAVLTQEAFAPQAEYVTLPVSIPGALNLLNDAPLLPSSVNNALLPSFPPIGNQESLGSCVAWATTYYQATHEIGFLNGIDNKQSNAGILSPTWTYNILDGGFNNGIYVSDAYQLLACNGAVSIAALPYTQQYAPWDPITADWLSAIYNRMGNYVLIPGLGGASQNLSAIKAALANGHVLTFCTYAESWVYTKVPIDPENIETRYSNQLAVTYMNGTQGAHCATIVGYDDNLWIDLNENGKVDPGERGAFLVASSWGSGWGNKGFVWISYDAFLNTSAVAGGPNAGRLALGSYLNNTVASVLPKAKNYTPNLVAEFTLTQAYRNQISIGAGVSATSATAPSISIVDYALNNQGGNTEFDGGIPNYGTETWSFIFDMSDLLGAISGVGPQRYYLKVGDNTVGSPTVLSKFDLIDLMHKNITSCSTVPVNYDSSSGVVYIDYDFAAGTPTIEVPSVLFISSHSKSMGGVIDFSVLANDTIGVANVQFLINSMPSGNYLSYGNGRFAHSVDTFTMPAGTYQFSAIAIDLIGNSTEISTAIDIVNPLPSFFVNVGGTAGTYDGHTWTTDANYLAAAAGFTMSDSNMSDPVYSTAREAGVMSYNFRVPYGDYSVTLMFAEDSSVIAAGQRVFNVYINGIEVMNHFDIFAAAGQHQPYNATFPVSVTTNADITIKIADANYGYAKINGIQIVPAQ